MFASVDEVVPLRIDFTIFKENIAHEEQDGGSGQYIFINAWR